MSVKTTRQEPPNEPAQQPFVRERYIPSPGPAALTYEQLTARVEAMARGDLAIAYPDMPDSEVEARIKGDRPCNQLHEIAIARRASGE